jgi:hypothetical protein
LVDRLLTCDRSEAQLRHDVYAPLFLDGVATSLAIARWRLIKEAPAMTADDEATAMEKGRLAGRNTASFAGECPFSHSHPSLRTAWMDGFGEGRNQIAMRDGAENVAERSESKLGN